MICSECYLQKMSLNKYKNMLNVWESQIKELEEVLAVEKDANKKSVMLLEEVVGN